MLAWITRLRPRHIVVVGSSMEPRLKAGQHYLVFPYLFRSPRRGDCVLAHDPRTQQLIVKRIQILPGETLRCMNQEHLCKDDEYGLFGDQPEQSTDSRHFGPIKRSAILGRLLMKKR